MKKRIWLFSLLFLLTLFIYLVAGVFLAYRKQPELTEQQKEELKENLSWMESSSEERVKIIRDNEAALLERIRLIEGAKEEIIMSTFSFQSDESGKLIIAALLNAADRGVSIKVIVDGFNGILDMEWNPHFYALSSHKNVEMKIYNYVNILKPWKSMGRMHDKYLIVDDSAYILGGRNTFNYFLGNYGGYKNYDWDILVSCREPDRGASINQLKAYFETVWNYQECKLFHNRESLADRQRVKKAREEMMDWYTDYYETHKLKIQDSDYEKETFTAEHILLLSNPITYQVKKPVLWYELYELMCGAKDSVVIHTPYVICNEWMYQGLSDIVLRVGDVKLMTNSVANNGNPFGAADYKQNKERLLDTGIEVWEYEGGYSYHGKGILIDDHISIIGSFNIDMRSTYLDTELMLVIDSREINRQFSEAMQSYEYSARKANRDGTYDNPYQVTPMEMDKNNEKMIGLVEKFIKWLRFLF